MFDSRIHLLLFGLCVMRSILPCDGYAGGAREDSCVQMQVTHNTAKIQTAKAPYFISTSSNTYERDTTMEVTLAQGTVKGFMVQAKRLGGGSTAPLGTWQETPGIDKPLRCSVENDTITQSNAFIKNGITLKWLPPRQSAGEVIFVFTIVHDFYTFWEDVRSSLISPGASYNVPLPATTTTTSSPGGASDITTSTSGGGNNGGKNGNAGDGDGDGDGDGGNTLSWEWALVAIAAVVVLVGIISAIIWCCMRYCCAPMRYKSDAYIARDPYRSSRTSLESQQRSHESQQRSHESQPRALSRYHPSAYDHYRFEYDPYGTPRTLTPPNSHTYY